MRIVGSTGNQEQVGLCRSDKGADKADLVVAPM